MEIDGFRQELESVINKHSKENESNTPDYILAQYLSGCLAVFNIAVQQREAWYGRDPRPSLAGTKISAAKSTREEPTK